MIETAKSHGFMADEVSLKSWLTCKNLQETHGLVVETA